MSPKFHLLSLAILFFVFGKEIYGQRRSRRLCPGGCYCRVSPNRRVLYSVRCMNLGFNEIPKFAEGTRSLDLRFNSIQRIDRESFRGLSNVNTLLLTNNQIESIEDDSFVDMTSLKHLYLQKNSISKISEHALRGLLSLENLYLYDNKLAALEASTFAGLSKLERLFLYGNKLSRLPETVFSELSSLKRLRLDNNHLECNCDLLWFRQWLIEISRSSQITAICHSPQHLAGRAVRTIPLTDLQCSAPTIKSGPEDKQVENGGTIHLLCVATGSPKPNILWYHNGNIVQENARTRRSFDGSLMIMNARETDAGSYQCKATNNIGSVQSQEARVLYMGLNGPPFFMTSPHNRQVMTGDAVTLDCRAAGSPQPIITWLKNKKTLPEREELTIRQSGALHIPRVQTYHNGTYTCIATNSEGVVKASADILVRSVPVFTDRPRDLTVLQGQSAMLDCHTTGVPQPKIMWFKNGNQLPVDQRYLVMSSGSLLIRVTNPDDEGRYTCRAHSSAGIAESTATLTVQIPPHFTVRPQNQRVQQATTVDFQCQGSGRPQPHIVWTKNDRAIPDDDRYTILASGTLRILRVDTTDAGNYRCEIANGLGARHAQVSLEIIPTLRLAFTRTSSDQEVSSGEEARMSCHVSGGNLRENTVVSWSKDGVRIVPSERFVILPAPESDLTIKSVARDDAGRYECTARNNGIVITSSSTLTVNVGNSVDEIVDELMDLLPPECLRQGCTSSIDFTKYSNEDIDYLLDFNRGLFTSHSRKKRQSNPIQRNFLDLQESVFAVHRNVDNAINSTIDQLNDRSRQRNSHDLFSLMRFPSSRRNIDMMKAAEVFDVSLRLIECCVRQGAKIKYFALRHAENKKQKSNAEDLLDIPVSNELLEDEIPMPVIGTEVVALVANLSGCSAHQKPPDCSDDICFHRKYRTADGTCNNLQHPMWGASLTPFHRILQPVYENGFNSPIGWNSKKRYNNESLPSPRAVSIEVLMSRSPRPATDAELTHMTMQWGQFVDHDLDFTTMAPSIQRFSDGTACKESCDNEAPCFPIEVSSNDPRHSGFNRHHHGSSHTTSRQQQPRSHAAGTCMEFTRSSAVCGSGITSVFFSALSRREQINQITSYHDASSVYGSTKEDMRNLRDLSNDYGMLKEGQPLEPGQKPLLPYNVYTDLDSGTVEIRPVAPIECRRGDSESAVERSVPCFLAGDLRANEQVSLTSMHTMFMREHNRIARQLRELNDQWDGDTIFNEARKIVGAQMQHITYKHWLPKLLGSYMDVIGDYRMYNPNQPASIVNVFATAAYRFGHTMINPIMYRLNETYQETEEGNLMLHQAFFAPYKIVHEGGIDPLVRGLIAKPMKARDADSNMNSELIERLFVLAEEVALDLGALNVQRGRDHALPFYNEWREFCNLTRANSFDDLQSEISNSQVIQKLRKIYKTPHNIDAFVGMILEDITPGSRLGPTLGCLIAEQFKRVRDGDRLWYENPGIFSPEQLTELRQASLARIICDNSDNIKTLPKDVFLNTPTSEFVSCEEIPRVDLRAWVECCENCQSNNQRSPTITSHFRRTSNRRSKRQIADEFDGDFTEETHSRFKPRPHHLPPLGHPGNMTAAIRKRVTTDNSRKAFRILKPADALDDSALTQSLAKLAKQLRNNIPAIIKNNKNLKPLKPQSVGESNTLEDPVTELQQPLIGQLLDIIQALESKLNSLQTEVHRLRNNIDNEIEK